MMGVEHLGAHHCISIPLSTKNAIVEEEMPAQDAVESNLFFFFHFTNYYFSVGTS